MLTRSSFLVSQLKQSAKFIFALNNAKDSAIVKDIELQDINIIAPQSDINAVDMAGAYSHVSNEIGVVISGSRTIDLISPIQNSNMYEKSLLVITNQDNDPHCGDLLKINSKMSYDLKKDDDTSKVINYAIKLSKGLYDGRKGPVHLNIRNEIQESDNIQNNKSIKEFLNDLSDNVIDSFDKVINKLNESKIEETANILNNCSKPIILVGDDCGIASDELLRLSEKLNIPVVSTIDGVGCFDETNKLSLKNVGLYGLPSANYAIQEADCLLSIGVKFDNMITGKISKFSPNSVKINVELDYKRLKENDIFINTQTAINSCPKVFLNKLLEYVDGLKIKNNKEKWIEQVLIWKDKYKPELYDESLFSYLNITEPHVLDDMKKYMDKNTIITTSTRSKHVFASRYIDWKSPKKLLSNGFIGSSGCGLSLSIGAKLAKPNSRVICYDYDDSFLSSIYELETVINHNLPIKIALMNFDNKPVNYRRALSDDFKIFNEHLTIGDKRGVKLMNCVNDNNMKYFMEYNEGPLLCEFFVHPTFSIPYVYPGKALDDITFPNTNKKESKQVVSNDKSDNNSNNNSNNNFKLFNRNIFFKMFKNY